MDEPACSAFPAVHLKWEVRAGVRACPPRPAQAGGTRQPLLKKSGGGAAEVAGCCQCRRADTMLGATACPHQELRRGQRWVRKCGMPSRPGARAGAPRLAMHLSKAVDK